MWGSYDFVFLLKMFLIIDISNWNCVFHFINLQFKRFLETITVSFSIQVILPLEKATNFSINPMFSYKNKDSLFLFYSSFFADISKSRASTFTICVYILSGLFLNWLIILTVIGSIVTKFFIINCRLW